jgi:hypothetical protein
VITSARPHTGLRPPTPPPAGALPNNPFLPKNPGGCPKSRDVPMARTPNALPTSSQRDKPHRMGLDKGKDIALLAIGATFGLGVALMTLAVPDYLANFQPWVTYSLFWGGLAIMVIMIADAVLLYAWWDREEANLGPALLINLGLCLVAVGFMWHYAPPTATKGASGSEMTGPQHGPASGAEVASARLTFDGAFEEVSHSAKIKSVTIRKIGFGLASETFKFQVAFSSNYGPFTVAMEARDYGPVSIDIWTPVSTVSRDESDNFIEFDVPPYAMLGMAMATGPTDVRLIFYKR